MLACLCPSTSLEADPRPRLSAPPRRAARNAWRTSSTSAAKRRAKRLAPGHQHVVVIALRLKRRRGAKRFFQTPANPIALDRAAYALGHRQSDARARRGLAFRPLASAGLQREGLGRYAPPSRDALKFRPLGQAAQGSPAGSGFPSSRKALRLHSAPSSRPERTVRRRPKAEGGPIRRRASCGRARAARRAPCGRPPSPSGRESHDGACAPACWVDRSASPLVSESVRAREQSKRRRLPRAKTGLPQPPLRPSGEAGKYQCGASRRFKARLMPRKRREVNCGAPDRGLLRATYL